MSWSYIRKHILIIQIAVFANAGLPAQQQSDNKANYRLNIYKTDQEIKADGILDEAVWSETEKISNFYYCFPVDYTQVEQEYQTEVMITYDDKNIYVAAICHGSGPYSVRTLKRDASDFWRGEVFSVIFDPANNQNNAFGFSTNSAGVQFDNLVGSNTGTRSSNSSGGFNVAWDNTWTSNSKSYPDKWVTELTIPLKTLKYGIGKQWGINFGRGVSKTNSFHTWAPVPVQFRGADLSFQGAMIWDDPPPTAKSKVSVIPYILASTVKNLTDGTDADNNFRVGADAKIALNSNLNLDLTINPDFSQVDVDEQVTNLTTVNIRFPERRLFFTENSDIFSDFGIPPMRPFFSRKIGLDEGGAPIQILYGARLSGNLNKDLRIGLMNLQTKQTEEFFGQNYTSFAFNQRVFGRTSVKGFFHNRQGYEDGEFSSTNYNRVFGAEFDYRSIDGNFRVNIGTGISLTEDAEDKRETYQWIVSYANRNWNLYWNVKTIGDNYASDFAFMSDQFHYNAITDERIALGYNHHFTRGSYTFYPKTKKINSMTIGYRNVADWTQRANELFKLDLGVSYTVNFASSAGVSIAALRSRRELLFPFVFTDEEPLPVGEYNYTSFQLELASDNRKLFNVAARFNVGGFYNGNLKGATIALNYRRQPWANLAMTLTQNYLDFPDPYGSESLTLIGPKLELNFSRNLFWTSFLQYNTQADNFNINSRFQWQFNPLSNIFVVYSDNYAIENWGPKNRALVVKMNYWLNL